MDNRLAAAKVSPTLVGRGLDPSRPRLAVGGAATILTGAVARSLESSYDVLGTFEHPQDLEAAGSREGLALVVAVVDPPGLDGWVELTSALGAGLVWIAMTNGCPVSRDLPRVGVHGYLSMSSCYDDLLEALQAARARRAFIARDLTQQPHVPSLTPRQAEVLTLLARGLAMKQIGTILGLATRTVAFHKYEIMKAHKLNSTAGLLLLAVRLGLAPLE